MEKLFTQSTDCSPEIHFCLENNIFRIKGESCMSDANLFYADSLEWLRAFGKGSSVSADFVFHFSAISQSSLKMLLFLCQELKSMQIDEHSVKVSWCFGKSDYELKEIGQDISYMTELEFEYLVVEDELALA